MGNGNSVQIANAFHQDVWVRDRTEKISELHQEVTREVDCLGGIAGSSKQIGGANLKCSQKSTTKENRTYTLLIEEGFVKIPKQSITTFKPEENATKTAYITILYYDDRGEKHYIANDVPHGYTHSVIITATGGVVDAKSQSAPWIDKNGKNHRCEACCKISTICTPCLIDTRLEVIQNSIRVVRHCRVAKALIASVEAIKQQGLEKKAEEVNKIIKEIETLAKHYWTLEAKTKRVVRDVKAYGQYLVEAADDFMIDHDIMLLLTNVMDMSDVKESLKSANEEHEIVKGSANRIQELSQMSVDKYKEKEEELAKLLKNSQIEGAAYVSTPIVGQIASFAACGYTAASETIRACSENTSTNNIPVKMLAGGLAGAGGAVGGLALSLVVLPASPFLWWHFLSKHVDVKCYKDLKTQFVSISSQMIEIEKHLITITDAISDIETCLNTALRAEKYVAAATDVMRERMVLRMRQRAEELIASCDSYFSKVNEDGPLALDDAVPSASSSSGKEKKLV